MPECTELLFKTSDLGQLFFQYIISLCLIFFSNRDSAELGFVALITDLLELDLFILRKPKSVSDRSEALILGCAPSENCAQVGTSEHLLPLGP